MSNGRHFNFDWRFPLYAIVVVLALFVPLSLTPMFDFIQLFFLFLGIPVILLLLLLIAALRRSVSILAVAVTVALTSYLFYLKLDDIRFTGRWVLWSHEYKEALRGRTVPSGELPHVEWDGWGFAGSDTVVYVVFDSSDSLSMAARRHASGKVPGIPCGVWSVHRLERNWYSVVMFTNTAWDQCDLGETT